MSGKAIVRMTVKYGNGEEEHYQFNRQEMDEIQLARKTHRRPWNHIPDYRTREQRTVHPL